MLNLVIQQPGIDKIYLYTKDPYEAKYQLLINKREGAGIKYFNNSEAFIEAFIYIYIYVEREIDR